jgi:segregation and condensation protein B
MMTEDELKSTIEALIYVADEPIGEDTLVELLGKEHKELIRAAIHQLIEEYQSRSHGIEVKFVAGGLKMATKPEHHEWVRKLVKHLTPPMKLSLPALETLAVIAYRQPITLPEIQEVRGVNAGAVLKTLLEKKLINTAGRKNVIGRPILYRTTKEFLIQFGLKDLNELPSLEEFEELAQASLGEEVLQPRVGTEMGTGDGSQSAASLAPSFPGSENREGESRQGRLVDQDTAHVASENIPTSEV